MMNTATRLNCLRGKAPITPSKSTFGTEKSAGINLSVIRQYRVIMDNQEKVQIYPAVEECINRIPAISERVFLHSQIESAIRRRAAGEIVKKDVSEGLSIG